MANPTSIFDFAAEDLAAFLAKAVSDGTQADVFNTLKVDNPGEEALATDIDVAGGQLLSNGVDDFIQSSYPFIRAVATETFVDLTVTNDLSVGNDINMTSASPTLTVGDGTGAPKHIIDSVAFGIGSLVWSSSSTEKWSMNSTATDDMTLTKAAGALVMTIAQSDSLVTWEGGMFLGSASPTLTVGDASGSPKVLMNKDGGGTSRRIYQSDSASSWAWEHTTAEDLKLQRAGDVLLLTFFQSTGRAKFENELQVQGLLNATANVTLDSASPTMTSGNASGSPIIALKKTGGGTGALRFREGGGAITNWAFIDDATQNMVISRQGGVEVLKFVQASGLAVFANSVTLDSASPTLAVGDGTGSPIHSLNKSDAGTAELKFQKAGVSDWIFKDDASEDLVITRQGGTTVLTLGQSTGLATFANNVQVDADLSMPGGRLQVNGGITSGPVALTTIAGRLGLATTDADATDKSGIVFGKQFTNSHSVWMHLQGFASSGANTLNMGGGQNGFDAATKLNFYTGAAVDTNIGTVRLSIDSSGLASFKNSVELDSASPTLTVGDGTGSPLHVLDKSEGGLSSLAWKKLGVDQFTLTNGTGENMNLSKVGGTTVYTIDQTTSLVDFREGVKVRADLEIDGALNHDGSTAGFFATTPVTQPDVSGSRASGAALVSLIAAGVALGLWTDSTVA